MSLVKLKEITEFVRNGANIKNDKEHSGIPITRIETIADGTIDINRVGFADIKDDSYQDYYLRKNDILMSHINSLKHLGKTAFCEENIKLIHGMNLLMIRPNSNVYPKYLYYYFNSSIFKNKLLTISKQSVNQCSFTVNDLKDMEIDISDYDNQCKIAKRLDSINKLISIKNSELKKYDELIISKFADLFGTVKNNERFDYVDIGELIDKNITKVKKKFKSNDLIKYIDISSIDNKKNVMTGYTEYRIGTEPSRAQQCLNYNDIVVSTVRPNLRNIAINKYTDDNIVGTSGFCVLRCNKCTPEYLMSILLSDQFTNDMSSITTGANYPAIHNEDIYKYRIPNAPFELQKQYSEFVKKINIQKQLCEGVLKKLKEMQSALMQEYFG